MGIVDPIQPYFVLSTNLYHKRLLKDSPIAHFYQFTYTEEDPAANRVVPDGTIDLILDIQTGAATLSGSVERASQSSFLQGHSYFGARFKPGAMEHFGDISFHELTGTSADLADVPDWRVFEGRIGNCKTFANRADVIEEAFLDYAANHSSAEDTGLLRQMLELIYTRHGMVSVYEMEKVLFYSRRHLLRVFRQYVGMDIKSFCSIVRFQSVLMELNSGRRIGLAEVAQKYGYYDQTHFQKEFKKFSMLSPSKYRQMIMNNGYYDRILVY